jgi:alpha-glucosidase
MFPDYLPSIHHDGSPRYVRSTAAALHLGDNVTIRLRTAPNAAIERVLLRTCPDGEQAFAEMHPTQPVGGEVCQWWQAVLKLSMPVTGYRFLLFTRDGVWWYNGGGLQRHVPTDAEDFRLLADYTAPDWVSTSVFYQIFPDRFADGDPSNNVATGEFMHHGVGTQAKAWGEPPSQWPQAMVEFYGGDLAGVLERLDYLSDLGISAIYFNPIFKAHSNHRYDVMDYFSVDAHLGGNAALAALRQATARHGLRFILDVVPNHCGVDHPWFQAALQDPAAPTAEYFTFRQHPNDYDCWLGVSSLPKLNYRSQALRDIMYGGAEAVLRYWLRPPYAIDGWRVDVANMLGRHGKDQLAAEVWAGIRQAVKDENPAAYLLGENFFDGTTQLQGDHLDATMNYAGFTHPVEYWLNRFRVGQHAEPRFVESPVRWSTQALVDSWQASRAAVPWAIACQQFNLLGSHDTPRILDKLAGNSALNRLAVVLLFTYVGVPCVYYGDEIGMRGADPLRARDCMVWDETQWDGDLRAFYQTLIRLRRTSPALSYGGFQVLLVGEDVLAYLRDSEQAYVIVVANRGGETQQVGHLAVAQGGVPDGTVFVELFTGQQSIVGAGVLPLPALSSGAQVWQAQAPL